MIASQKVLDALKTIGLNLYERKLYVALLARGSATAGELAELAQVPRSRTYDTLESLADKGFVIIQQTRPVRYIAIDPEEALERYKKRFEEKINEMKRRIEEIKNSEIMKELKEIFEKRIQKIQPEELTGTIRGLKSFFDEIEYALKNAKSSIHIVAGSEVLKEIYERFAGLLVKAKERNIDIRFLATDLKEVDVLKSLKVFGELRTIEKDKLPIEGNVIVVDDENVIMSLTDIRNVAPNQALALWTRSENVAKNLIKPILEIAWNNFSKEFA
ncbi:MAG: helix-turn-helix domain-containing protein [Candidatus Aenigmatarchaeota archaeon]